MSVIVSFSDYTPEPRYDGVPFTSMKVDEGPTINGPWTELATFAMIPVDADPSHPAARTFTVVNATLVAGWYRVRFIDAGGNFIVTEPIQNVDPDEVEYLPSLAEVGEQTLGRTKNSVGNTLGTFTVDTEPTDSQVGKLILAAATDVRRSIGSDIPNDLVDDARRVIAVRTAMLIELTMFGSEVSTDRSPYPQLKDLYKELLAGLSTSVAVEEAGKSGKDQVVGNFPAFGFPGVETLLDKKM